MLLKNGKTFFTSTNASVGSARYLKTIDGTVGAWFNNGGNNASIGTLSIQFGTGSTPPTVDDYVLESPVSNIAVLATNIINATPSNDWNSILYVSFTIQNNNAFPVEVKECALYITGYNHSALLTRDVFTPVTVEAGAIYTVAVNIT